MRRVRRHYLSLLATALALGFGAFLLAGYQLVPPILAMALLIGAAGILIFAVMILRSGVCPRCDASLMWKESRGLSTASRISLLTRKNCRNCGLDLDAPFTIVDDGKG